MLIQHLVRWQDLNTLQDRDFLSLTKDSKTQQGHCYVAQTGLRMLSSLYVHACHVRNLVVSNRHV